VGLGPTHDLMQVNARGGLLTADGDTVPSRTPLAPWAHTWLQAVTTAAFPWDRAGRAQYSRRPHTGLGQTLGEVAQLHTASTLMLQRQRFDKAAENSLRPYTAQTRRHAWTPELGLAVLDTERLALLDVPVVVLPAPYLDLDATFLFTRWAAEVNTSRRSDHDARYRVS